MSDEILILGIRACYVSSPAAKSYFCVVELLRKFHSQKTCTRMPGGW